MAMKKLVTFTLLLFCTVFPAFSQKKDSLNDDEIKYVTQPRPKVDCSEFVSNNIQYPQSAKDAGISGRVCMDFVVNEDGSIGPIYVKEAPDSSLAAEARRIIGLMPNWEPGRMKDGTPVKVFYHQCLRFDLGDKDEKKRKRSKNRE